jgi:DNA repair protein RadA/Sms
MSFYICSNCGYGSASWIGRCPDCSQWNTFKRQSDINEKDLPTEKFEMTSFAKIKSFAKKRLATSVFEFDRVIGGGFIPGEIILLTGEPGVGKSTLLLQILQSLKTLYISGEESAEQVKDRIGRLGLKEKNLFFTNTREVEAIINGLKQTENKFDILVIDSIQTVYSSSIEGTPGSINQLKESASRLIDLAKTNNLPIIFIGHITKEGEIAGPKTLEHMVDAVLSFEGEKISHFRILRATKNRFGSTDEIGIFEMTSKGLAEVKNPLAFLDTTKERSSGMTIVGIVEGKRPLFFEIQALASPTLLAIPRRVVKGVDYNKILLLLAVIKKYLGLSLDQYDIYINVVGGVNIKSPAADIGIVAAIVSSIKNISIKNKTVFTGEIGLLGEIRKAVFEEKITNEARRLGFQKIYSSKNITTIRDLKKIILP